MEWYYEAKAYLTSQGYYKVYREEPEEEWLQDQSLQDAQQMALARLSLLVAPNLRRVVNIQITADAAW